MMVIKGIMVVEIFEMDLSLLKIVIVINIDNIRVVIVGEIVVVFWIDFVIELIWVKVLIFNKVIKIFVRVKKIVRGCYFFFIFRRI